MPGEYRHVFAMRRPTDFIVDEKIHFQLRHEEYASSLRRGTLECNTIVIKNINRDY